jgi:MoxR-like ATPase
VLEQQLLDTLSDLDDVANLLKSSLVAKDELVELLLTCAIAQEHLLIVGPPGTGKSELVKRFALLCTPAAAANGRVPYFEYLLTRFTEPSEIFGPINIAALRRGKGTRRNTEGMLPHAEIAFFDEIFKANSAILNALLAVLNERIFYNGGERDAVPLICAVGATNAVPDDEELAALYDRFLVRVWTDNVEESLFLELFRRGWQLERERIEASYGVKLTNVTTTDALRKLNQFLSDIDLSPIANDYREVVRRLRAEGIALSDRRMIKLLKLIAASALRHRREAANPGDFWLLRHVWNDPEQIPHLQHIVNPYVEAAGGETYSAERPLAAIQRELDCLEARGGELKTDTDYADFLQQLEALRRELQRHSASAEKASPGERAERDQLAERIDSMIDKVMQVLEDTL